MSQAKNKVEWCMGKAKKELEQSGRHRGLVVTRPSKERSLEHINKAEHYIEATLLLEEKFSDIGASTIFYSMYHSMLAILAKFGYESRNQECTFALIYSFIEDGKIDLSAADVDRIASLGGDSVIEQRERYQYGVELSMKKEIYSESLEMAKKILGKAKEVVESEGG